MNNCVGIINLDGNERKMGELVVNRTLASVPIAARYRIIDFVLSNMTNSGIDSIGIFTKNKSRSLIDHLTNGKPWDLNRKKDGLRVFNFSEYDPSFEDVHTFAENVEFLKFSHKEYVLLAPSYMICNINYEDVIAEHIKSGKDVTIVYKNIKQPDSSFQECNVLNFGDLGDVISIGENVGHGNNLDISMEMYVLKTNTFIDIVNECITNGMYRKVKEYINDNLDKLRVGGYEFKGYLQCISSLKALYDANLSLLNRKVSKEIFSEERPIFTKIKDEAPTRYTKESKVVNSMIANGCYIKGSVENCVIGRRVYIGEGVKLKNCVIMQNSSIGDNSILDNVIADKGTEIKADEKLMGSDLYPLFIEKRKTM